MLFAFIVILLLHAASAAENVTVLLNEIRGLEEQLNSLKKPPHVYLVHRRNPENIGDWLCTPLYYFRFLASLSREVVRTKSGQLVPSKGGVDIDLAEAPRRVLPYCKRGKCLIIVGGGGLLMPKWDNVLPPMCKRFPCALWGPGINIGSKPPRSDGAAPPEAVAAALGNVTLPPYMGVFKLGGIRDYGVRGKYRYLPDASCMAHAFDGQCGAPAEAAAGKVCYYAHKDFRPDAFAAQFHVNGASGSRLEQSISPVRTMLTNAGNLDGKHRPPSQDLALLSEYFCGCETVVTSSFHGVLWAQYLGRKVVLAFPGSSKFYTFRFPPQYYSGDIEADIASAKAVPEALGECRRLNYEFYKDVLKYLVKM